MIDLPVKKKTAGRTRSMHAKLSEVMSTTPMCVSEIAEKAGLTFDVAAKNLSNITFIEETGTIKRFIVGGRGTMYARIGGYKDQMACDAAIALMTQAKPAS